MFSIETSVNIVWLPVIVVISALVGFIFRSRQLKQSKKRILSLENEMLNNHADILRLQRELMELESKLPEFKSLVVSMKEAQIEENEEKPEVVQRKKLGVSTK